MSDYKTAQYFAIVTHANTMLGQILILQILHQLSAFLYPFS